MVSSAQGNGELIADFTAEGPILGKSEVVGIRGSATANQTTVLGDSFDVNAVTDPTRFPAGPARSYRLSLVARDALPSVRAE